MAVRKFRLLSDSKLDVTAKTGLTVYECVKYDYSCASDDTRRTGVQHISVTHKEDGDYPYFTHPEHLLEEIKE